MQKLAYIFISLIFIGCVSKQPLKLEKLGEIQDCDKCPELSIVPPGSFYLSINGKKKKITIHNHYAIGKYEITYEEWEECVQDGACNNLRKMASWGSRKDENWEKKNRPVVRISWLDTQDYIKWISKKTGRIYRLPSEAEWEYAARAGSKTKYFWGDKVNGNANCQGCGSQWDGTKTSPVGSFPPNSIELYDMHGNVYEWVEDCATNDINRIPKNGKAYVDYFARYYRILKGGSWLSSPEYCTSSHRQSYQWNIPTYTRGFRVVREIEKKQ